MQAALTFAGAALDSPAYPNVIMVCYIRDKDMTQKLHESC